MTTKHEELLFQAAVEKLGEDAGLGAVDRLTATYEAAPKLLEALQALVAKHDRPNSSLYLRYEAEFDAAHAAIAEAKGPVADAVAETT